MDSGPTSKVTVEYHDPSGVFPFLSPLLSSRLPLRNLHWKSPTRPLRSIESLDIDFVALSEADHDLGLAPSAAIVEARDSLKSPTISRRPSDDGSTASDVARGPTKSRRHQMPGLRRTPYLKVFFLRCDDGDVYKSTSRKQVREWVRNHASTTQSSGLEDHDAFEWLIVHVVFPDTPAANQQRTSGSAGANGGAAPEKSRWTRGATTTILEKLRADFNSSSKSAPDRVSQVRLRKSELPEGLARAGGPATSPAPEETQDPIDAWNDLIAKFKILILTSFDSRVRQYEEDIRDRNSQRALPGWNFCTFFILKEGLANGFESVGLVDDALIGYDELSIGLDSVIRDQQSNEGSESPTKGGTFLDYTDDLIRQLYGGPEAAQGANERPISADRKNYRERILSNNISIFDFKSYIFARQMTLLLRLGRPLASEKTEDLLSLAELCERTLSYVTLAARIMREDIQNGAMLKSLMITDAVIDNFVSSWTYSVIQQVLDECFAAKLPQVPSLEESKLDPRSSLPARTSSLVNRRGALNDPPYATKPLSSTIVYDQGKYNSPANDWQEQTPKAGISGLEDLAGTRSELYMVQRRIVERIGQLRNWSIGWSAVEGIQKLGHSEMAEVDLDEESTSSGLEKPSSQTANLSASQSLDEGLWNQSLLNASTSVDAFRSAYEDLSGFALKSYLVAGRPKSAERIMCELAILKFQVGDYARAATYFTRVGPSFAEQKWNFIEVAMLKMHARCLKELHRRDEYIRMLLHLLAKSAGREKDFLFPKIQTPSIKPPSAEKLDDLGHQWLDDDHLDTRGILNELLTSSNDLPYDITVPMAKYFADITVEPYLRLYDHKDGFQLRLKFRHLLQDDLRIEKVRVRLIHTSIQGREIWLEGNEPVNLRHGPIRIWVHSNVVASGFHAVDKITLKAEKITFQHEFSPKTGGAVGLGLSTAEPSPTLPQSRAPKVHCYPHLNAFETKVSLSKALDIDKPRSIEIKCSSGWNNIRKAELRFKSASAGLRLHTANTSLLEGAAKLGEIHAQGVVQVLEFPSEDTIRLRIPFELETALTEISIRVEANYDTENGHFIFFSEASIPIQLPLDVNVQDLFKATTLFSRFLFRTPTQVPIQILDVNLHGTNDFSVQAPACKLTPFTVLTKQPVTILFKITRLHPPGTPRAPAANEPPLKLVVGYSCVDEHIWTAAETLIHRSILDSEFKSFTRLIVSAFTERLREYLQSSDFERTVLLDAAVIPSFDALGWKDILASLPPQLRNDLAPWLRDWHAAHPTLNLKLVAKEASSQTARQITITVPVPRMQVVHTATIHLQLPSKDQDPHHKNSKSNSGAVALKPRRASKTTTPVIPIGHPLPATLRITHTRAWDDPASLVSLASLPSPDAPLSFVVDIDASPETWLLAGRRRTHFTAREADATDIPLLLVPLRTGALLLPAVDVRPFVAPPPPPPAPPYSRYAGPADPDSRRGSGASAGLAAGQGSPSQRSPSPSLSGQRPRSSASSANLTPTLHSAASFEGEEPGSAGLGAGWYACETEYRSGATTVAVVDGWAEVEVAVDAGGEMENAGRERRVAALVGGAGRGEVNGVGVA